MSADGSLSATDVREAAVRLSGVVYRTPLVASAFASELTGGEVFLKLENLQRTGSFKLRGAYNRMASLSEAERSRGVIAASAGNHAQGVALAARLIGTTALVVMPRGASLTKIGATRRYGAEVRLTGETFDDALKEALRIREETGRVFVPPFDHPEVIAGQGTVAVDMLEDLPDLDVLVVPVGGGGLLAGMALWAKTRRPGMRIVGVEAKGADAVLRALLRGEVSELSGVSTFADGIAVKRPGALPFEMIRRWVDDVVTVDDHEIARTILLLLERGKVVAEGAGAAGLAAILTGRVEVSGKKAATVVTGGNIDVTLLSRILEKGLVEEGRELHCFTEIADRPGSLVRLLDAVARLGANVLRVGHERWNPSISPGEVSVSLVLETRDDDHIRQIIQGLADVGYRIEGFRTKNFDN